MKLKHISWIPAVIIMVIIFYFSQKPADNSNEGSLTIANKILSVYESFTEVQYQGALRIETLHSINHVIRKGAHFLEYALLACAIAFHLVILKYKRKWLLLLPIIISAIYASTDELHQTLVPGRSGQIKDVLLDSAGAATGAILFYLFLTICVYNRRNRKLITSRK